jgi:hypothetical protein
MKKIYSQNEKDWRHFEGVDAIWRIMLQFNLTLGMWIEFIRFGGEASDFFFCLESDSVISYPTKSRKFFEKLTAFKKLKASSSS